MENDQKNGELITIQMCVKRPLSKAQVEEFSQKVISFADQLLAKFENEPAGIDWSSVEPIDSPASNIHEGHI